MQTISADVDEESIVHPEPDENVIRTALLKARTVAGQFPNALIVAADTTVALDGDRLGKPAGEDEARATLRRLRGRAHQVFTGIVLLETASGRLESSVSRTDVVMRPYTDEEIEQYIKSGNPYDKAGGYAIQNSEFHPVESIQGCYSNVVGLPLCQLVALLRRFGVSPDLDVSETGDDYRQCTTCLTLMRGDGL